jgi:hypothetical protein
MFLAKTVDHIEILVLSKTLEKISEVKHALVQKRPLIMGLIYRIRT